MAEAQQGGRLGAACWAVAAVVCAGWRHSALEALWMGRTAAGFASVRPAGWPEGREASLLQNRKDPQALTLELPSIDSESDVTSQGLSQTRRSEPSGKREV